jgi:hypothetical protein
MGSGQFAEKGPLLAAYVRNPKYHDLSWFGVEPPDKFIDKPANYKEKCYNRSTLLDGLFFLEVLAARIPGALRHEDTDESNARRDPFPWACRMD